MVDFPCFIPSTESNHVALSAGQRPLAHPATPPILPRLPHHYKAYGLRRQRAMGKRDLRVVFGEKYGRTLTSVSLAIPLPP